MKKKHLVLILLCIPFLLNAQFTPNGSDLYHTNGNVGIGTNNSPLSKLHIIDGTGVLRTTDNGDGIVLSSYDNLKSIGLSSSGNGNYGGTGAVGLKLINGDIRYYFEGIEKVTFQDEGRVGIGTSSPAFQLHMKDPIGGAALGLEKGVEVGEFQMKLLQKVEELTLYIIEHQKEMKFLKRENKIQQAEIKELKKKLK